MTLQSFIGLPSVVPEIVRGVPKDPSLDLKTVKKGVENTEKYETVGFRKHSYICLGPSHRQK